MSWKHTLVTCLAAAFGQYVDHKLPGVDPTVAAGLVAGLLAHFFHLSLVNGNGNGGTQNG